MNLINGGAFLKDAECRLLLLAKLASWSSAASDGTPIGRFWMLDSNKITGRGCILFIMNTELSFYYHC